MFLFQGRHARHLPATEIPLLEAMDKELTLNELSLRFEPGVLDTVDDLYQDHMGSLK